MSIQTIKWVNGKVKLIDQTKLPQKLVYCTYSDVTSLWKAIKQLKVRGAPALGVAGAFGVLLGLKGFNVGNARERSLQQHIKKTAAYLRTSRPTAVNLFYALERMEKAAQGNKRRSVSQIKAALKKEAFRMYEEDRRLCRAMGKAGSSLIRSGSRVLTICNTGVLATVDYGTAAGVMYAAKEAGKRFSVYACETRPLLQGARLTTWELMRRRIDVTLICDNMAATLMKQGKVDLILTGADRIAANGDTANKIGTYMLAVLAKHHRVPFYVVAPSTTFDLKTKNGRAIPIEQRDRKEVIQWGGIPTAPKNVKVYNPAFDVTPHELITGFVTEKGIIRHL
ncbi:MAG TPA: S-methyl-5-thioribose-1-phosphate isomerase [Candidatus Omnitrophota bacterium]|nr:S-methyl-5-thioribose-1-phosphate isomerase [Candidatus Omnitrophota bacterium]